MTILFFYIILLFDINSIFFSNDRSVHGHIKDHDLYQLNKEKKFLNGMSQSAIEDNVGGFGKFRRDILYEIGRRLILGDYTSFRSCNKECWMGCPKIQWRGTALKGFEDYSRNISPWLIYSQKGDKCCSCLDVLHGERHLIDLPNNLLEDVTLCHSRSGWCVMLKGEVSIFLWNLFAKEIILLPDLAYSCESVVGCTLSPAIDQVILIHQLDVNCIIEVIRLREGIWNRLEFDLDFDVGMEYNLACYGERICLFDIKGNLVIFEEIEEDGEAEFKLVYKASKPCFSSQSFLMECDGKLLSVLLGESGNWIRIFTLDFANKTWAEIENLGNKTLYVSRFSCFSTAASTLEMSNRVYFPRYCDENKVIYYSLSSKKLHVYGTEQVLRCFENTQEQLLSCWIEVKWC